MTRIYIETNFVVGTAFGREPDAERFLALSTTTAQVKLCLPEICIMEAFSSFEDEQKRRNRLRNELEQQISDLGRRKQLPSANLLLELLEAALIANKNFTSDIQTKMSEITVQLLGQRADFAGAELLPVRAAYAPDAFSQTGLPTEIPNQPTDTLILRVVCADALQHPGETKVFVSANTRDFGSDDVRRFLTLCGIRYFASTDTFSGWLDGGADGSTPVSA